MTIVALTFVNESFLAISDTRISGSVGPQLEKFSKLFAHRYEFTCMHLLGDGPVTRKITHSGELGLAFAGSTLFGLAFSNMFARTIAEMHSSNAADPPTFSAFTKIAEHCAKLLCDYVLGKEQCFDVLIFGFDPASNSPSLIHLWLGPGVLGLEVSTQEKRVKEDDIVSIGTGAKHLPAGMPKPSAVPLEILVSEVISSGKDAATGGDVQVMELDREQSRFFGTMTEGQSWDDALFFGIKRSDLGEVEGYHVGRANPVQLRPFAAVRNLAFKKAKHLKATTETVPLAVGNVGPLMSFLAVIHEKGSVGVIDESYSLSLSPLISGQYYFSKVCPTCWRNSPSILSPAGSEGFQGKLSGEGSVSTSCQFCGNPLSFKARDFSREVFWSKP
jgi:hypothetical protein